MNDTNPNSIPILKQSIPVSSSFHKQINKAQKYNKLNKFQNAKHSKFLYQNLVGVNQLLAYFSFITLLAMALYYQVDSNGKKDYLKRYIFRFLEIGMIIESNKISSNHSLPFINKIQNLINPLKSTENPRIIRQPSNVQQTKSINALTILHHFTTVFYTRSLLNVDLTINNYNLYDSWAFQWKINYFFIVFGAGKMFTIIQAWLRSSEYMSPRSKFQIDQKLLVNRINQLYQNKSDIKFAFKCMLRDRTFLLLGSFLLSGVLFFILFFKVTEGNLDNQYPRHMNNQTNPKSLSNLENTIWLAIVTMSEVGYGDYYPKTLYGRVMAMTAAIWGSIFLTVMINSLLNTVKMDQSQRRTLIVLNRLNKKKELKYSAAFVITQACKRYLHRKRMQTSPKNISNKYQSKTSHSISLTNPIISTTIDLSNKKWLQNQYKQCKKLQKYSQNFKRTQKNMKNMYDLDNTLQEMYHQFDIINDILTQILKKQHQNILTIKKITKIRKLYEYRNINTCFQYNDTHTSSNSIVQTQNSTNNRKNIKKSNSNFSQNCTNNYQKHNYSHKNYNRHQSST